MRNAVGTWAIGQCLATSLSSPKLLLKNTVLCKSNANTCRRNSKKFQFFDEFLTKTKLSRHFCEFSRDVLFWTARTFGDMFLNGINATRNFERKFVLCGEYFGRKFVGIVHSFKKVWLNLWFGTALCKTPMEFPPTIWVSTRLMLFATMVTLSVSIVSMRLGSFTYSTLGSHRC